jgi:hypothetical protein
MRVLLLSCAFGRHHSIVTPPLEIGRGGWTRTSDLHVMSVPSCQLLHPAITTAPFFTTSTKQWCRADIRCEGTTPRRCDKKN